MANYSDNLTTEQRRAKWREHSKKWRAENRERFMATTRKRNADKRPVDRVREQAWRDKNREALRVKSRKYAKENPEINKAAVWRYQAKKRLDPAWLKKQCEKSKAWRAANPEKALEVGRKYHRVHSETDANYVIKTRLRARLQKKLRSRGIGKSGSTQALTGCTTDFLRGYLEARFLPGMTWKDVLEGRVQIDHHIPCAEFDLRDPEQQRTCFSYTNLRPMWAKDNNRKGARHPGPHQAELI